VTPSHAGIFPNPFARRALVAKKFIMANEDHLFSLYLSHPQTGDPLPIQPVPPFTANNILQHPLKTL